MDAAGFATFFFDASFAAEFEAGAAEGFVTRDAGSDEFGDVLVEVEAEFVVEFGFDLGAAEDGAQADQQVAQSIGRSFRWSPGPEVTAADEFLPFGFFGFELFEACFSELVKFSAAIIFGRAPAGSDPAAAFEAMEGGIERALLDLRGRCWKPDGCVRRWPSRVRGRGREFAE